MISSTSRAARPGSQHPPARSAKRAVDGDFLQRVLADGYVGDVLSTTMVGLSVPGDVISQPNVYMLDRANGANLLTVPVDHSLDTLTFVLGGSPNSRPSRASAVHSSPPKRPGSRS